MKQSPDSIGQCITAIRCCPIVLLRELEYRLIIKLGTMIVVAIGIVAMLVKLL